MHIQIGSRESQLAVAQAEIVAAMIQREHPEVEAEIIRIKTSGDMIIDRPLEGAGGKGLFTRELDAALLEGRIDIAVHSLKDIPAALTQGLVIAVFCAEEDPWDALVLPMGAVEIEAAKPIGCAGKRRSLQLAALFPGCHCALVRGNVPTRLAKLDRGEYSALVLAAAGLKRLGLEERISRIFEPDEMLPATGQGILAVVTRLDAGDVITRLLADIDEPRTRRRALAERSFTRMLDGGCGTPVAAFAREEGESLIMQGLYCPEESESLITSTIRGSKYEGEALGRQLACRLLAEQGRKNGDMGKVSLVGAGPGDPGLLTVRGAAALAEADVVVFDKLAGPGLLAQIPSRSEKIYAGKETGHHTLPQEEINGILVKKAAAGLKVLRLKGGDPCLFGRGGEEALCLARAGIPFEIIPGVSSALAVPEGVGIPVTHRGIASRLHIIAAHNEGIRGMDYPGLVQLAKSGDTLVFLMSRANLRDICRSLLDAGLAPGTGAAIIEQGTTSKEKKVISTLGYLVTEAEKAGIKAPAVTVVGEVCRLAEELSAFAQKPLSGLRIAVTRPRGGVSRLSVLLAAKGAEVIDLPTIRIVPIADTPLLQQVLAEPLTKTWFAFTSVHGVEAFFDKIKYYGRDIRSLGACKFAAVGKGTGAALLARGIITDLVPETFSGPALGAALAKTILKDERVILPRSAIAGQDVLEILTAAGIPYLDIPVYDTIIETGYEDRAYCELLTQGLDYVAFTSPSAVEGFVRIFRKTGWALCIGETTAAAARRHGMETLVPKTASLEGMVEVLLKSPPQSP